MIFLGLVALLLVGVHFTLASAVGVARRRHASQPTSQRPTTGKVAVLIVAHNRQDQVVACLNSAARVVPLANVFLVSDGSTDGTAELARDYGVKVVETYGRLGRSGAVESGIQAFQLLDQFAFILLIDVDTRLDPHHLLHVLPMFGDPIVAAVDVRVEADRRLPGHSPVSELLTAYRARAYALSERLTRAKTLPSVARTYRTSALAEIEINPPGLAVADFDTALQLHRRQLGRVDLCTEATARTTAPTRFTDYHRQTNHWFAGFWQAIRRHALRRDLACAALITELLLTSVLFTLVPLAFALTPLLPWLWAPAAAVLIADYLLTVVVAIPRNRPRFLLLGLLFPLLRLIDAVTTLRTLPRSGRPSPAWLDLDPGTPGPSPSRTPTQSRTLAPKPPPPRWRTALIKTVGWVLAIAAAAVVVARVARTASTLPPSMIEPGLVDSAYGRASGLGTPNVDASLAITELHLRMYATVTSAFGRHGDVLTAARELSIAAAALLVIGLLIAAAVLRVRPLVIALAMGMLAVSGPVITLITPVGPGAIAAAWLAIAVAAMVAAIGWQDFRWVTAGGIALLIVLPTAPSTIIPIGAVAAAWFAFSARTVNRWLRAVATIGILTVTAATTAALWWSGFLLQQESGLLGDDERRLLLTIVAAAAIGGLVVSWLRPVAAGIGAGAGFVAAVGPRADVLLPALVLAAVILVAVLIEDAAGWQRPSWQVLARRSVAGLAGVAALAGSVVSMPLRPPSVTPPDHAGLAQWVTSQVDRGVALVVPPGIWSDLGRDLSRAGLPPNTVRREVPGAKPKPDELVVTKATEQRAGVQVAQFDTLAVLFTGTDAGYQTSASRVKAGKQLAENSRLTASDEVRAALRAGQVDLRAMATLAAICQDHLVTVAEITKPGHELRSPMPYRVLIVSEVDGQPVDGAAQGLLAWLRAQEPPFAPTDIRVTPSGVLVGWRLPARLDLPPL